MSAQIKRYVLIRGSHGGRMSDDQDRLDASAMLSKDAFVLHADHLASHAYDEAVERAAFEAEFKRHKLGRQEDDGFYVELYVDALWQGWEARAKRFGGEA